MAREPVLYVKMDDAEPVEHVGYDEIVKAISFLDVVQIKLNDGSHRCGYLPVTKASLEFYGVKVGSTKELHFFWIDHRPNKERTGLEPVYITVPWSKVREIIQWPKPDKDPNLSNRFPHLKEGSTSGS